MLHHIARQTLGTGLWLSLQSGAIASPALLPSKDLSSTALRPTAVDQVVDHLVGILDTSAQAQQDAGQPAVQMTTCRITVPDNAGEGSAFLYQEQALSVSLTQPYRQRILQVVPFEHTVLGENSTAVAVEAVSYRPLEPEALTEFCDRPLVERSLTTSQVGEVTCRVYLTPILEGFRGVTPPEGCPTQVRGAVRVTNEIMLHNEGMDTWDRGFDAAGEQIWGATEVPYQFRWQSPNSAN